MPTIVPKTKAQIGQRSGFSQVDGHKINTLYECSSDGSNKPLVTILPRPQPQPVISIIVQTTPSPLITVAPLTLPTERPDIVTSNSIIIQPETLPLIPLENCTNIRPDCESLAAQGWCTRNPHYMRSYCPAACNMCEKSTKNSGSCEDLRVDCRELVRRRYCITAQTFSKQFCAKSCKSLLDQNMQTFKGGFCFAPPVTETPDLTNTLAVAEIKSSTAAPTKPLVTFWPIVR